MLYSAICPSPVGRLTMAADDENLLGLWLEGQKYFGAGILREPVEPKDTPILRAAKEWIERYFAKEKPSPKELPLHPIGSVFQSTLWALLCEIPYGEVTTYGALARKMAAQMHRPSMSGQAVGGAVGHNPISIIIPCHRVIAANGSLAGYAGGIDVKLRLLSLEGVDCTRFKLPKSKPAHGPSEENETNP